MTLPDVTTGTSAFSWKGRRVIVTGAAGFVGSWLSETLVAQGARVTAIVRARDDDRESKRFLALDGIDIVKANVEDAVAIDRGFCISKPDTVFHLAAINVNTGTSVPPVRIFETNTRGTWNVLEACRQTPSVERLVIASSREAEESPETPSVNLGGRPRRRHPYQVSKMAAELVAHSYSDCYDLPLAICQSDNVYGGRDLNWNRLIPGTVQALLEGKAPVLRSDGTAMRDYVFVDEMVDAYLRLAAHASDPQVRGQVIHFGTGRSTSVMAIVTMLCELSGRPDLKPILLNESTGERRNDEHGRNNLNDLLGWQSSVGIREGLELTINWYREYFAMLDRPN